MIRFGRMTFFPAYNFYKKRLLLKCFHALKGNFVSLTPLHVDLTQHGLLEELSVQVADLEWS